MDKLKFQRVLDVLWGLRRKVEDNGRKLFDFIARMSNIADNYSDNSVYFNEVLDLLKEINEYADSIKEEYSGLQGLIDDLDLEIKSMFLWGDL